MKKLMIAAAIVCAAAMSQAASIKWFVSGVTPAGEDAAIPEGSYWSYCFLGSDSSSQNPTFNPQDIVNMVLAGEEPYDLFETGDFVGTDGNVAFEGEVDVTGAKAEAPITMHAYAVIIDDDAVVDGTRGEVNNYALVDLGVVTFVGDQALTARGEFTGWTAVPEPTSGLLLLIGVAGLALRRRRA